MQKTDVLFCWDSLEDISPHVLNYDPPIPGKMCKIKLVSGHEIYAWRGDDCQTYFCHGLTFGGKEAPGGPISPFSGDDVMLILQHHYERVEPKSSAVPGDILVWETPDGETPHSAILVDAVVSADKKDLDYSSKLRTKNGKKPETIMSLEELIEDFYGESYNVYRRKEGEDN